MIEEGEGRTRRKEGKEGELELLKRQKEEGDERERMNQIEKPWLQ